MQKARPIASVLTREHLRFALAALVAAVALSVASPSARANLAAQAAEREFADAVEQFKQGKRALAFGKFIRMANRGDVDAARIALFMHTYGPTLWGAHWEAGRIKPRADVLPKLARVLGVTVGELFGEAA